MRLTKFSALTTLAALVTGCAVTPSGPLPFNPQKSRALNIAEAGGIYKGVKDAHLPKDTTGALTDSVIYNSMYAGMGFINPGPGLSNLQGFGMGILAGLFEPDSPGARNSLMAWMPVDMAKDEESAQRLMSEIVVTAAADALVSLNYPVSNYHKNKKPDETSAVFISESYPGCANSKCMIWIYTPKPYRWISPQFVSNGIPAYAFSANGTHKYFQARMDFPKELKIPTLQIYEAMSKRLPSWVYVYMSPEKTFDKDGQKIKFPILLEKGEPHLFVVRE